MIESMLRVLMAFCNLSMNCFSESIGVHEFKPTVEAINRITLIEAINSMLGVGNLDSSAGGWAERQAQPPRSGVRATDCDLLKVTLPSV